MPCLALRGVAKGIAKSYSLKAKILLRESWCSRALLPSPSLIKWTVNSKNDRETEGYTAVDFVEYGFQVYRPGLFFFFDNLAVRSSVR